MRAEGRRSTSSPLWTCRTAARTVPHLFNTAVAEVVDAVTIEAVVIAMGVVVAVVDDLDENRSFEEYMWCIAFETLFPKARVCVWYK